VLVLVLATCVLGEKRPSSLNDGEVLSRTVSVRTPERVSNVISHFTPADHRFDAVGSVLISKDSGSPAEQSSQLDFGDASNADSSTLAQQRQVLPAVSKSLRRTVSVKTPERVSNVISHFTPADHRFEARGSVIIDDEVTNSPRPRTLNTSPQTQAPIRITPIPVASAPKPVSVRNNPAPNTGKLLSRTVSIKTPERVSSVISHFTPADHRFDATGSVVINQGSAIPSQSEKLNVVRPTPIAPALVATPAPVAPLVLRAEPVPSTGKSLSKTVSIKTPERVSSVISHFTPADHRFDATGSVVINQGSAKNLNVENPSKTFVRASPPPSISLAPVSVRSDPAPSTGKSLSRTVSVKTPERVSSVISHFTPADHRFDATGSVSINQGSSSVSHSKKLDVALPSPVVPAPVVAPAVSPAPVAPVVLRAKPSPSTGKSLSRTVSVKTPERVSSVISHFTPADHRFDATGSVIINQGSAGASQSKKLDVARPTPIAPAPFVAPAVAPAPVAPLVLRPKPILSTGKSLSRTVSIKTPERVSSLDIARPTPVTPARVVTPAVLPAPVAPVVLRAKSIPSTGKSLSRSVSVKTPERVSSVISHFTPADHRFDATGSVVINQGSAKNLNVGNPSKTFVRASPPPSISLAPVSVRSDPAPIDHRFDATGSVVINQGSASASRSKKLDNARPTPVAPAPVVAPAVAPAPVAPFVLRSKPVPSTGKSLSRTVSIKTPERVSSVISHFTPAVHRFDATGSVLINQGSSSVSQSKQFNAVRLAPVTPAPVVAPAAAPAPVAPVVLHAEPVSSTGKSLSRTVSVKTPERVSSVISHFTPADHRFDATGSVLINQGSSSVSQSKQFNAVRLAPVTPAPVVPPAVAPAPVAPVVLHAEPVSSTGKSLSRTVSVKTPERVSSVISHFTPADHRFDATGSVLINEGSTSAPSKKFDVRPVHSVPAPVEAPTPVAPVILRAEPVPKSGKSLSRTISVKSPDRVSSVISHFTPADHSYDATGSVVINEDSSASGKSLSSFSSGADRVEVSGSKIQAPVSTNFQSLSHKQNNRLALSAFGSQSSAVSNKQTTASPIKSSSFSSGTIRLASPLTRASNSVSSADLLAELAAFRAEAAASGPKSLELREEDSSNDQVRK
ncbi:hypothetical protein SK128_014061, partial [Halocaridina rubra]